MNINQQDTTLEKQSSCIETGLVTDILNLFRGVTSTEKIVFNLTRLLSLRLGFRGIIVTKLMDDGMLQIVGTSEVSTDLQHKLDFVGLDNILDIEACPLGAGQLLVDANSCSLEARLASEIMTSTDVLLFPIKDRLDHEWGWLLLDTDHDMEMTDDLLFTLELASAMAHNALENAGVNAEIKVELSRNRFLYEITNLLNSDFEFDDSVTEVIHRLQSSFGYFWVGFWTSHTDGTLKLLTQAGLVQIDDEIIIPEGKDGGVIGIVAANGHFFTVNDASSSRQNRVLGMQGFMSELAVPIIKNEKVYGVLDIRSDHTYAFDQKTRRFARIIANQLAQAIYTRKSIEDRMKELRIRRSIIDVGRIISSILDLETLLKKSLDVLLNTFNYWGASIYLSDESGENLSFAAQAGAIGNTKRKSMIKAGKEGIVGLAASTRKITNIPDVNQFPFYIQDMSEVRSEIAVPIVKQRKLIGVLDVYSRNKDAFNSEDEEILELFANNMSVAIANAKYHKKVQELAIRDGLTGLYNHRHFMEAIEREVKIAKRFEKPLSLLMMDIDHFKRFNDTYGHPVGDRILKVVAETLRANIRNNIDIPSRYGGEEFTVILIETPQQEATEIAERIRQSFRAQKLDNMDATLSLSCGVASYPENSDNCKTLIDYADKALYRAKNAGRNRTIVFENQMVEGD